jgi:hypothetical protein
MRLDISGLFVVNVVTPNGGRSKGRPIALIEDSHKGSVADLLVPNGLTDRLHCRQVLELCSPRQADTAARSICARLTVI